MADQATKLSNLFVPELYTECLQWEMQENFQALSDLFGMEAEKPFRSATLGQVMGGGQFRVHPKFNPIAAPIQRRDLTAEPTATVDTKALDARTEKSVVVSGRIGPFAINRGVEWIANMNEGTLANEIAQQVAQYFRYWLMEHMIATLKGAAGAFAAGAGGAGFSKDHIYSCWNTSTGVNLSPTVISKGRMELGDGFNRVGHILMRSESFGDLVEGQIAGNVTGIADKVSFGGIPATLNTAYSVWDSAHLYTADAGLDKWYSYLLGANVLEVEVTKAPVFYEPQFINVSEQAQIILRGDLDITIKVPGLSFTGTANPTEASLATAGNWTLKAKDHREFKAVALEHNSSAS